MNKYSLSSSPPVVGVMNGPNLNMLGQRSEEHYGTQSLKDIEDSLRALAAEHNMEIFCYQSNVEGHLIDVLQQKDAEVCAWIINPGALAIAGYALADAIIALRHIAVEVHISKIFQREAHRHHSVIAPHCYGQIIGFGTEGYLIAFKALMQILSSGSSSSSMQRIDKR